jgi:hypothetical protein
MLNSAVLLISGILVFALADVYVSPLGSDGNTGTADSPFRTIQKAQVPFVISFKCVPTATRFVFYSRGSVMVVVYALSHSIFCLSESKA